MPRGRPPSQHFVRDRLPLPHAHARARGCLGADHHDVPLASPTAGLDPVQHVQSPLMLCGGYHRVYGQRRQRCRDDSGISTATAAILQYPRLRLGPKPRLRLKIKIKLRLRLRLRLRRLSSARRCCWACSQHHPAGPKQPRLNQQITRCHRARSVLGAAPLPTRQNFPALLAEPSQCGAGCHCQACSRQAAAAAGPGRGGPAGLGCTIVVETYGRLENQPAEAGSQAGTSHCWLVLRNQRCRLGLRNQRRRLGLTADPAPDGQVLGPSDAG
jgi:hypothetical protein